MTDAEIVQTSRHFIGHLAVDPAIRERVRAAATSGENVNDKLAAIINAAVKPATPLQPHEVPAVGKYLAQSFHLPADDPIHPFVAAWHVPGDG